MESWPASAPENHRRGRGFRPSSYGNSCEDQQDSVPRIMQRLLNNTTAPCGPGAGNAVLAPTIGCATTSPGRSPPVLAATPVAWNAAGLLLHETAAT